MRYLPSSGYRKVCHSSVTILVVQRNEPKRQEETARNSILQLRKNQARRGQPFASGLLLGAVAVVGITRWLLESQSRKAAQQEENIFSWPAIVRPGRR